MPSQNKLIKQGIKYTDSLFKEITKRIEQGVKSSDTLEEFLANYNEYTNGEGENNPLVLSGYKDEMLKIILQETNNHKFSRPSQKELVRVTIENQVGELIVDVGEDIQRNVRDIVKEGYNNNLSQDEIAANISSKVSVIKNRRARTIARTEVARTATISDYVINAEMGATHFYVECRNTACPICKKNWHKKWTIENDDSFTPKEYTAGKKGWVGDKVFSMGDTSMLPPVHPNCRCVPYFISESDIPDGVSVEEPTQKETTTTTTTEPQSTDETKTMLKGTPKVTQEINGTTYTYENGLELYVSKKSYISHEEVVNHINSLPEPLRTIDTLKRIEITPEISMRSKSGEYIPQLGILKLYRYDGTKNKAFDVLNHELAHALDSKIGIDKHGSWLRWGLSNMEVYDKIFKADNKLGEYVRPNGKTRIPNRLVTDYAGRSWKKYKKAFTKKLKVWKQGSQDPRFKPVDQRYIEDFAESTKLYLNPTTHDQFVKDYPNRAEYLESIYGKPKFDKNTPQYQALMEEGLI